MIMIESDMPVIRGGIYKEYYDAIENMNPGQSFLVDDILIIESVRHYAWSQKIKTRYRVIKEVGKPPKWRLWRL